MITQEEFLTDMFNQCIKLNTMDNEMSKLLDNFNKQHFKLFGVCFNYSFNYSMSRIEVSLQKPHQVNSIIVDQVNSLDLATRQIIDQVVKDYGNAKSNTQIIGKVIELTHGLVKIKDIENYLNL